MSSGSVKGVVGEKGEKKDVVSSSAPAARSRAQTRADRTEMNLDVISPRSTTLKATIASSGPRGISQHRLGHQESHVVGRVLLRHW